MRESFARLWHIPLISAVTALAGCGQNAISVAPARTIVPDGGVELKAQKISDLLLVGLHVNDHGPFRFLVDTGSGAMIVSCRLADTLAGFTTPAVQSVIGATGESLRVRELFHIDRLHAGDAIFEQIDALVVDLDGISRALGVEVDGIAGFPLFTDCLLTLDHSSSTIRLSKGNLAGVDGVETLSFALEAGRPIIPITVGQETLRVVLDSGASSMLVLPPGLLGLTFNHGPVPGSLGTTITGSQRSAIGRLRDALRIGRFVIREPVVVLMRGEPLIGGETMKHFETTFDTATRRVRFRRSNVEPIAVSPVRTTGLAFEKTQSGWTIADIIPETPAVDADVLVGDRLVTFEGRPADEFTRNTWAELESQRDELHLVTRRGDLLINVDVRVTELVP